MKNNLKKLFNVFIAIAIIITHSCNTDDESASKVTVAKVSPETQFMTDPATIEGSGLNNVKYVFVGKFDARFTLNDGIITFIVPASAPVGPNVITLVMEDNYRVTSTIDVKIKPIPTVSTITPSAAAAGENVSIYGTNLNFNTTVKVGTVDATVVSATDTQVVFRVPTIPNNTRSTPVTVTTTFGSASPVSRFFATNNLILNSELELGAGDVFTNWSKFNGAAGLLSTRVAGESYFGRGLRVIGDGRSLTQQWRTQFVSDRITTVIGRRYLVFMWIRSTAANGSIRFSTMPTGGGSSIFGGDITIGTDWTQVTFEFTANSPQTQISLDMGSRTNTYFVDNITMVNQ